MWFQVLLPLLFALPGLLAAPTASSHPKLKRTSVDTSGRLIVSFKDDGTTKNTILKDAGITSTASGVPDWSIIHAFVVDSLDDATLTTILDHPEVVQVEEEGNLSFAVVQTDAPWGLARMSSPTKLVNQDLDALTYSYTYNEPGCINEILCIDIYVLDSGIRTTHQSFQGRATWGANFIDDTTTDGNGHGTHCAGTAASWDYGIAKKASLIAVKVGSDEGDITTSSLISGINYAAEQYGVTGRPSVMSISITGLGSDVIDSAVQAATALGVHVVVSAGNINFDALWLSPAREPTAITVGASNITDSRASFSDYGAVVDIFAPGVDTISAGIASDTATEIMSGTSMSAPAVAGLVAYLISLEGQVTPAEMSDKLKAKSLKGLLDNIPDGTVNYLAYLG
ncbi:serine protease [Flagelloscypha sp. PMI_526]|nr:serine protease [Flagelloscypha sp. PMI_526]